MIHASFIEKPRHQFTVCFERPPYYNVLWFPGGTRTVIVLAETEEGALKVARYHYHNGSNFRVEH